MLGPTLFLLYIHDLPDGVICNIAIYAVDATLNSKWDQVSDLWQQVEILSELESDLQDTVEFGSKWLVDFSAGKTELVPFDQSNNTGAIDGKMHGSVLEEKSSFKMIWLSFSSKLDWGYCIISIGKTVYKKIGVLTHSMKFLSCEVAFYFFSFFVKISHIILHNWHFRNLSQILCIFQLCMEYSCHDWAGALVARWNC